MLRFSLAILTALTIAVVGSIAWDAGQHLDDLWRRSGEGAQCARLHAPPPSYRRTVAIKDDTTLETALGWHRGRSCSWWGRRARGRGGLARIPHETRLLIPEVSLANRLRGAPRFDRALLKLGIEVAQWPVAKSLAMGGRGRPQTWK